MTHITDNITYLPAGYGHKEVQDLHNQVKIIVTSGIVEDCDTEDEESVEKCLAALRNEWAKKDKQRFNIVIDLGSKGERYMIDENGGYDPDPLTYKDAWHRDEAFEIVKKARELYADAWTEEVEPFEF